MTKKKRTAIPADASRLTKVEAGHQCAIWRCGEILNLERHHIDFNPSNLVSDGAKNSTSPNSSVFFLVTVPSSETVYLED